MNVCPEYSVRAKVLRAPDGRFEADFCSLEAGHEGPHHFDGEVVEVANLNLPVERQ